MPKIKELKNGLKIISEKINDVKSVSIGIFVKAGSVLENEKNNGIAHFLEHLAFKGTSKRNAKKIAQEIDILGGRLNAYTTKEYTAYYTVVIDEKIKAGFELLSDLFLNSLYQETDINLEKNVVLEEIKMYQDTPDELVHDLFCEKVFDKCPLGYPILGKAKNIKSFKRQDVLAFKQNFYNADNIIISVAGNFDEAKTIAMIEQKFASLPSQKSAKKELKVEFKKNIFIKKSRSNQNHLCFGWQSFPYCDEKRYALLLLNTIFGGNISSSLFQEIREKRGLAYSIYSYNSSFFNDGYFTVYAGTEAKKTKEVIKIIKAEAEKLKNKKISDQKIKIAKDSLKAFFVLNFENTASRMSWNAKSLLYFDKLISLETSFAKIEAINWQDLQKIANKIFDDKKESMVLIGKLD